MDRESSPPSTADRDAEVVSHTTSREELAAPLRITKSNAELLGSVNDDGSKNCSNEETENGLCRNGESLMSKETLWGSPYRQKSDFSLSCGTSLRDGTLYKTFQGVPEPMQLNEENLSQMKKEIAEGKVILQPEFIDSDPYQIKRMTAEERNVSVISVGSETEDATGYSILKSDVEEASTFLKPDMSKRSYTSASRWSVESVGGSSVVPDFLSRSNLDRFSSQLRMGVKELRPEILLGDTMQDMLGVSNLTKGGTQTSLCVEVESETRDDYICPFEETKNYELMQRHSRDGRAGEHSGFQTSLDETPQMRGAAHEVTPPPAPGLRPNKDDTSTEFSFSAFPDHRTSGSLRVWPPSPNTCSEENWFLPPDYKSNVSSKFEMRGKVSNESNARAVHEMRQNIERALQEIKELKARQVKLSADMSILQQFPRSHAAKQPHSLEGQAPELQEVQGSNLGEEETQLVRTEAEWAPSTFTELRTLWRKLEDDLQGLRAQHEGQMSHFIWQVTDRFGQINQLVSYALTKLDALQQQQHQQEDQIDKMEVAPPVDAIPDGEKVHLMVDVQCCTIEHCEVLLPISVKATVGMCKRELLRRLHRQGLVDKNISYADVILLRDTLTLYEEDVLGDVLVPALQNIGASRELVKLTLRTIFPKSVHSLCPKNDEKCARTTSPKAQHDGIPSAEAFFADPMATSGRDARAAMMTLERHSPLQQNPATVRHLTPADNLQFEDFGVLRGEAADELSQNELLYRRLIWELERSELEELRNDEKMQRVAVAKEGIKRIRLMLLDRATHSTVEGHRHVARSALENLDTLLVPGATVEEICKAAKMAQKAVKSIGSTHGEDERVAEMQEAMRAEQDRKQRTIEEIKELCDEVTHRLRIPANLLKRAESLAHDAQRAIILAPNMTQKELEEVHQSLVNFRAEVCI
ncbi:hypothetical protein MOQ_002594 [Trypanosoma cruzi marinkellei]|uniref:Uncharacterized protein n=1 Tax=Trypanosoma cruzi marinkellei TaxID=85056 RepID=K2ME91_TRYCR|nr:hypothetical protein MOQ_002594 [Trypanosoma cruzi marinkellei]